MLDRRSFIIASGLTALAHPELLERTIPFASELSERGAACETCSMWPRRLLLTRLWL